MIVLLEVLTPLSTDDVLGDHVEAWGRGALDAPDHRIQADTGRVVPAYQLDQVTGVPATDVEDALPGVKVGPAMS